ncbi:hypothetical protein [Corynebacterium mastitidis]|uniref:hypothetical protein n=1 Tax=Corynebacterium mastitidis TaxID=161890 RepID=UPI00255104A7|nr:hypothetical protein [Corynebacterium mastitidis]MDK8450994.1 hypothetical protein [Corynebacterium mastitidis]
MPDFQEHYGLRLSQVALDWHPVEVLLLIAGLPPTSRYAARLMGEEAGRGWSEAHWLLFDLRNAVEAMRAMKVAEGKKKRKPDFREWKHYPGAAAEKRRKLEKKRAAWRKMAGSGEMRSLG